MICAHVTDTHLDERCKHESLPEQVKRLVWIGEHAKGCHAEVLLHAGDVFERLSTPAERNAAIEVFQAWAEHMPVVAIEGNHDRPNDLAYLTHLASQHPIVVTARPDVISVAGIRVACLPWPRKSWLASKVEPGQDINAVAADAMRAILAGFAAQAPDILLAHVEVGAALLDTGQPMSGRADIELSVDELSAVAPYVALGHIHKRQEFSGCNGTVCYAGSPRQTTFGEGADKGYTLVATDGHGQPRLEHINAPGRTLHSLEATWDGEDLSVPDGTLPDFRRGAMASESLRLTYHVDASDREQADAVAKSMRDHLLAAGAHSVKLDPRIRNVQRARCEEIRSAASNADRIRAWWTSRGETPSREGAILDKLNELEGEI